MIIQFLFGAMWLVCGLGALAGLRNLKNVHRAPGSRLNTGEHPAMRCSVIIAARNEEARIEKTIRRLAAQQGAELEIIVVNDRSTDRTASILKSLQQELSRLKVIEVSQLPHGWLGKCHACHVGAAQATGDWLLFTDADCWMAEDLVSRALEAARFEGADHVTMTPGITCESFAVRAWFLLFLLSLSGWIAGVNRNKRNVHIGIGAFNLVRASSYRQVGGHEKLKLCVVDDIWLGMLLSRAGFRTRAYLGSQELECDWGRSVWDSVKLLEKNYFATLKFNVGIVAVLSLFMCAFMALIVLGFASGTMLGLMAGLAPLWFILPGMVLAERLSWPKHCALGVPFMFPVFYFALVNSACKTLRQGGIRWRDTFYSIDELRKGMVH